MERLNLQPDSWQTDPTTWLELDEPELRDRIAAQQTLNEQTDEYVRSHEAALEKARSDAAAGRAIITAMQQALALKRDREA